MRIGHTANFPVAYHSPRNEGTLRPSRRSRHSLVVHVDREGKETSTVDALHLQPAHDLAVSLQRAGFILHAVHDPWPHKVAEKQRCSYLTVKGASALVYKPTNEWKIPKPDGLFDKDKSITEQHVK